ncbi:MAG: sigma-70 family RNA polymerase sigma factor [Clostridiales bacterium]|nr:sigma-70 family RNA polymerase sigma factor [Clostridiales bacterium]
MNARELLEGYGQLQQQARAQAVTLATLRKRPPFCPPPGQREEELRRAGRALQRKISARHRQLVGMLDRLGSLPERQVLELRYLHLLTYEDISLALNYSPRHIYRLHLKGMARLNHLLEDENR